MFRKLVSSVSFSPALVGQLGFYAKRLKKEEATRRLGLIFTALALVVQSFIVFAPPEAANAASSHDLIYGGISSKSQYLSYFDKNVNNLQTILTSLGLTRAEIAAAKENQYIRYTSTNPKYYTWGHGEQFGYAKGERPYTIYLDDTKTNTTTVYARPAALWGNLNVKVMVGQSAKLGWFALVYACGNLVTVSLPPQPPAPPSPSPVALCENTTVIKESDTQRRFHVITKTAYGATVNNYSFAIKDSNGTLMTKSYSSNLTDYTSPSISLSPGAYTVTSTVSTSVGNVTSANCQASFAVASPGVEITKTVNDQKNISVELDTPFTYKITVKNTGGTTLQQNVISDSAPTGIEFISASTGVLANNRWTYTVASLAPGASQSFTISAKATTLAEPGQTLIKNIACIETGSIPGTNPDDCDDATVEVPEKTITVCDLSTDKMVTIKKSAFVDGTYSSNPDDCVKVQVCDTSTNAVITIRKTQLDASIHTQDLTQCDDIQVCDLGSGAIVVISRNDFDPKKYSADASDCVADVAKSKSALNLTQSNGDATKLVAQASDRIRYTITAQNVGSIVATADFKEQLSDVLEYATIIDDGGGIYDKDTKTLTWPSVDLKPGESQSRLFTVQLASTIPAGARGTSNQSSYDCNLLNTYGTSTSIEVSCPASKVIESTASELPHTGPTENIIFGGLLMSIVVYFYARSRQMSKEVRLVRRDLNVGTL